MSFDREVSLSEEIVESSENGFCHHCKQLRTTYVMASCKYNSRVHGLLMPIYFTIDSVQLPNVEPRQT
jgi:hypothetical protein